MGMRGRRRRFFSSSEVTEKPPSSAPHCTLARRKERRKGQEELSGPSRFLSPRQKEKEGQIFVTSLEQKSVLPSPSLAPLIPRNRFVGLSCILVAVVGLFIYFNYDSRLVCLKPCTAGVLNCCILGNLA